MRDTDDALPPCLCGHLAWASRGANISALLIQQWWRCRYCDRIALEFGRAGVLTFMVPEGECVTPAHFEWMKAVAFPQWDEREAALKAARAPLAVAEVRRINRSLGLPDVTPGHEVPAHLRRAWGDAYNAWTATDAYHRPEGLERAPMPPSVPDGLAVFVRQREGWLRA